MIKIAAHERLFARAFRFDFEAPLCETAVPERVRTLLASPAEVAPETRTAVRSMLRWGGFKASGRSKPASEYLEKAFQEGAMPSINAAVDICNAVSLHSGFPISVIDLELKQGPLRVAVVEDKQSYVFNPSGQQLDLKGLVCVWDDQGPCASPVKDSQRTKTHAGSRQTFCLIWGTQEQAEQVGEAEGLYRELLALCPGRFHEDMA